MKKYLGGGTGWATPKIANLFVAEGYLHHLSLTFPIFFLRLP